MGVSPSEHVAWRTIDGEAVVVDLRSDRMYGLNRSATAVWKALESGSSIDEMVHCLTPDATPHSPTPPEVLDALRAFLAELVQLGLANGSTAPQGDPTEAARASRLPYVPPRIVWQQEVQSFGSSCGFTPGGAGECQSAPYE
jgi:hypothetical protein